MFLIDAVLSTLISLSDILNHEHKPAQLSQYGGRVRAGWPGSDSWQWHVKIYVCW
jgi:hypothetical protein